MGFAEFFASLLGSEHPLDLSAHGVALLLPSGDLGDRRCGGRGIGCAGRRFRFPAYLASWRVSGCGGIEAASAPGEPLVRERRRKAPRLNGWRGCPSPPG